MSEKIYLALVNDDFFMSDEVIIYFKQKGIKIIGHSEKLGILKLQTEQEIVVEELKYIKYVELDRKLGIINEEEE